MQEIVDFFSNIESWQRSLIIASGFVFLWLVEGLIPLQKYRYNKGRHALVNFFFVLTTIAINLLFAFMILKASDWSVANNFGVLLWLNLQLGVKLVIGLMILDLIGAWLIHLIEHKVYWMWRFHVIHHSDTKIDTTTALRHHPGESIFRATFTTIAVLLAGAPFWLVMLYQSLSVVLSQFNHANLRLPKPLDSALSYVIVTPRMHHVHHHYKQPYTDTNYGNLFSIWDRLFNTFAKLPKEEIIYGLDVFDKREEHIGDLLELPVNKSSYTRKNR